MTEPWHDLSHWVTVKQLRELLTDPALRDEDILTPNAVANLRIERDGQMVGWVDLLNGRQCVEWVDDVDSP